MAADRSDGESDGNAFGEAVESCDGWRAIGESRNLLVATVTVGLEVAATAVAGLAEAARVAEATAVAARVVPETVAAVTVAWRL